MNKILIFSAAFLLHLCSCSDGAGQTTHIQGSLPAGSTAEYIKVQYWLDYVDIGLDVKIDTIPVINGRYEADIPNCATQFGEVFIDHDIIIFIADGSTLTIDAETHKVTSSDNNGLQSRFNAWNQGWIDLGNELTYRTTELKNRKEAGEDTEKDVIALQEEHNQRLFDLHKKTVLNNPDNVVCAFAFNSLVVSDPKTALSLVDVLSDGMKKNTTIASVLPTLEARAHTAIGDRFTDFEVEQVPADPRSTVKLSDYVGKGKSILLVFWASWCNENRKEMPRLKSIYEKYHGDAFDIVSIAVSDAPELSLAAAKEMDITWNLIVNAQSIPLELYGIRRIPDMILFGPDGKILMRDFWGYDDQILEWAVKKYVFPE